MNQTAAVVEKTALEVRIETIAAAQAAEMDLDVEAVMASAAVMDAIAKLAEKELAAEAKAAELKAKAEEAARKKAEAEAKAKVEAAAKAKAEEEARKTAAKLAAMEAALKRQLDAAAVLAGPELAPVIELTTGKPLPKKEKPVPVMAMSPSKQAVALDELRTKYAGLIPSGEPSEVRDVLLAIRGLILQPNSGYLTSVRYRLTQGQGIPKTRLLEAENWVKRRQGVLDILVKEVFGLIFGIGDFRDDGCKVGPNAWDKAKAFLQGSEYGWLLDRFDFEAAAPIVPATQVAKDPEAEAKAQADREAKKAARASYEEELKSLLVGAGASEMTAVAMVASTMKWLKGDVTRAAEEVLRDRAINAQLSHINQSNEGFSPSATMYAKAAGVNEEEIKAEAITKKAKVEAAQSANAGTMAKTEKKPGKPTGENKKKGRRDGK
jgi:hypothetical protein